MGAEIDWKELEDLLDALEVEAALVDVWSGHEPQARLVLRSNGSGYVEVCCPTRRLVVTKWRGDSPGARISALEGLAQRVGRA